MSFFRRFLSAPTRSERTEGLPASSNRASSLHARWLGEPADAVSVSVELTIASQPASAHLRFWALQASFTDGRRPIGAGHLGLQWIDRYPGHTAANWGGYHHVGAGRSGELTGTESALPSATHNVNTRNYAWRPGVTYRLTIDQGAAGWAGTVTDVSTGEHTTIRELACEGDALTSVVMWSEIFAPCEGPGVEVRWTNPVWVDRSGVQHPVRQVQLSYQSVVNGGCSNSSTTVDNGAVVQTTATDRVNPDGSVLTIS
jgi:hypothetical protein